MTIQKPDALDALEADVPAHCVLLSFDYNKSACRFKEW